VAVRRDPHRQALAPAALRLAAGSLPGTPPAPTTPASTA
jgi:hypothetical protein